MTLPFLWLALAAAFPSGSAAAGPEPSASPAPALRAEPLASEPLAPSFAPLASSGARPVEVALRAAVSALDDEDVDAAASAVGPLLRDHPEDRDVATVAGMVRFYQGRYAEAVSLLEKGGQDTGPLDFLRLARGAAEVTKGHVLAEGEHFVVSHPPGKDAVLVPYLLDALERQRSALAADLGWAPPGKVRVEILDSPRDLARLSPLTEEEIKTSGTIALCKFDKLMVVSPKALLRGYDWLDTAAHEYTHYVVTARTRNSAPVWLQEGLARHSESRWRGPGGELGPASDRLLRGALAGGTLIPFARMHPSMAKLPSQEAASLAFAQVAVAVAYLEAKGGQPLMNRVLDAITRGETAEAAVASGLGTSWEGFLAGWKRFAAARPLPPGERMEAEPLRFRGDPEHGGDHSEWAEIPGEKARGHARLGEIFRERGRMGPARQEYARAIRLAGEGFPMLSSRFALAAMRTGRVEEARGALAAALVRHPRHPGLQLHLARLRLEERQWAPAREALLAANAVDPFDPEIHAGLAEAEAALGEKEAAEREKGFARLLAGG